MAKDKNQKVPFEIPRPEFPKRAVVTGGMPYGNKELHFGHVGGMLVFADTYARFLRDRIGKENVVFVSGTDCYGSPIAEGWRKKVANGEFEGSLEDFVRRNHEKQKDTLNSYAISPNLFAASGLDRAKEVHAEYTNEFLSSLHRKGQLNKITTMQFFDEKAGVFLNGRQVEGKCPVEGCCEKGYADECALGHQYMPENLIAPKSTLTGETPTMKPVTNWYFKLRDYEKLMQEWVAEMQKRKDIRPVVWKTIDEFLKPPVIYVKREFEEKYLSLKDTMPAHNYLEEPKKPSFTIEFTTLSDCDEACRILTDNGIRYRTGKTLVPFRLTGNIEWGVPSPEFDEESKGLTVWVWPESLWAPISFTKTYLEQCGKGADEWKDYWCSKDATVYQFIGQDNIYFYGIAEPAMWMAQQEAAEKTSNPPEGELQLPVIVANHHILFLDKKASSSGDIKPPMADDLLNFYTPEQLRMHWLGLGLGQRSVSFMPKPYNPAADPKEQDPVVKDGLLLSNVYNRIIRTAFYTTQNKLDGILPDNAPEESFLADAKKAMLDYERHMSKFAFHQCTYVLDSYIRNASKYVAKMLKNPDELSEDELKQVLANVFYMIRIAAVLLHPMAPIGTEKIREYLEVDERIWSWDTLLEPLTFFVESGHKLKFLPPRTDFFTRHESQFADGGDEE